MLPEHVDVLIVGAGLSGIGAGYHLQAECPGKTYAILEARDSIGGTWDLFRYPGIRSDSDMHTLGYAFRPWKEAKAIADGPSILSYVRDTAREYGIDERIRFGLRVVRAEWSTADARWTVEAQRTDTGEIVRMTCGFLLTCSGYYRYDEGYTPHFAGAERFAGPDRAPAALDRRRRLRRQARRRDRQRRDRGHARPGDGADRGARHDAAALAELRRLAAGRGPDRPDRAPRAARPAGLSGRALEERPAHDVQLPAQPAPAAGDEGADPEMARAAAAGRVRHRHPLHAALQPLGPAHVPRARRRSVRGDAATGSASVVTDRIETFTETRHPRSPPARSSRPT